MNEPTLAIAFALTTSLLFGLNALVAQQGVRTLDSWTGTLVSIATTTLIYWCAAPFLVPVATWRSPGVWVFALNGVFQPMVTLALYFEGTRRLGPTLSATLSCTTPLFAVIVAAVVLAEAPGAAIWLGTLAIMSGVMALSWRGNAPAQFSRASLLFPLGTALIRGAAHNLGRYGMGLLGNALAAATTTHTVSLLGLAAVWLARGELRRRPVAPVGAAWFALSGVVNAAGVASLYQAIGLGKVVLVSPLVATYPVFTLLFGVLFGLEHPTRRTVIGVALIVPGVFLLGLFH